MKSSKRDKQDKPKIVKKVAYSNVVKIQDCISEQQTGRSVKLMQSEVPQTVQKEHQNFQAQQMRNIREKILLSNVNKNLRSLIALKNRPQKIKIYEQWQTKDDQQQTINIHQHQSVGEAVNQMYPYMAWFSVVQGVFVFLFFWIVSVAIVFQEKIGTEIFLVISSVIFVYIAMEFLLINQNEVISTFNVWSKIRELANPLSIIIGSIFMILRNLSSYKEFDLVIQISMVFVIYSIVKTMPNYFESILQFAQKNKAIKELRIIQAFCMLCALAHVFGLFIYSSVYFSPQNSTTWLSQKNNIINQSWKIQYIYSVYWAITTIVTVGYGDLTPQNHTQVVFIMIVQVFGTSYFGYMINVIGIAVFKINKKNEEYDNFQETISKLKDHYQLSDELCYEMKRDVKQKYKKSHKVASLKNNQEIQFLEYIDSTVKKSFIHQTNIRIIKKSLFFLTYFSVNCQNYIALKLIRIIYKKDEKVSTKDEKTGERNMVIVNNGRVGMFIEKKQNNITKRKLVKSIEPVEGEPTLNVIGYSSLILDRDINLQSQASIMTSGYILKRTDLLEVIEKSMIDYESFHQMREKMLVFNLKEAIEAQALKQYYFHYSPNKYILISKNGKKYHQSRVKSDRSSLKRFLFFLDNNKAQKLKRWFSVALLASEKDELTQQTTNPIKDKLNDFETLLSVQSGFSHNKDRHSTPIIESKRLIEEDIRFDQVKIFEHFMKNNNIDNVSANYEKCCNIKSYKKRIMSKYLARRSRK